MAVANTKAYNNTATTVTLKTCIVQTPGVDLLKLYFWRKFTETFLNFYEINPCGLYYKCFTIIIYNRNDIGQYYKTRITIIIDDSNHS
jgi:hypothetical protein